MFDHGDYLPTLAVYSAAEANRHTRCLSLEEQVGQETYDDTKIEH